MHENSENEPINYHDDNKAMRYLLHHVKGVSPVSGGVLGDALESEYEDAEEESSISTGKDFDLDFDIDV